MLINNIIHITSIPKKLNFKSFDVFIKFHKWEPLLVIEQLEI